MKVLLFLLFLIPFATGQMLFGFDALFEYKLKLQKDHIPQNDWQFLSFDDSFGLTSDVPEGFIKMGVCLRKRGERFYVLDNNLHKLAVFDKKGKFINNIGVPGRGPGDLYAPYWFEFYNDLIYITNDNGIDVFKEDMTFVRRIRSFLASFYFIVTDNGIYTLPPMAYKGRYQAFLRLNMDGSVEKEFFDPSFEKSNLRFNKDGVVHLLENHLVFISEHRNLMCLFDENAHLQKKVKIQYPFLDDMEKWNRIRATGEERMTWFANIFMTARVYNNNLYLLLNVPRLEILCVNLEGQVKKHYYNDDDFKFMRWSDFDISDEEGKIVFYILGHSNNGKEKDRDLAEFNVYRMVPSVGK